MGMDSANNDRATLYINRHFRHRRRVAVCVTDSCERGRRKESAKGGDGGDDGGVIEKVLRARFVNSPMIASLLTKGRHSPPSRHSRGSDFREGGRERGPVTS